MENFGDLMKKARNGDFLNLPDAEVEENKKLLATEVTDTQGKNSEKLFGVDNENKLEEKLKELFEKKNEEYVKLAHSVGHLEIKKDQTRDLSKLDAVKDKILATYASRDVQTILDMKVEAPAVQPAEPPAPASTEPPAQPAQPPAQPAQGEQSAQPIEAPASTDPSAPASQPAQGGGRRRTRRRRRSKNNRRSRKRRNSKRKRSLKRRRRSRNSRRR